MININDPKTGKTYKKEADAQLYMNSKIGEDVSGDLLGLKGYELKITGGSDKSGFPMRKDVTSLGRKRPLVVSGVGAKHGESGVKQRKSVHGNHVDENIAQLNLKIVKYGKESIEKALGITPEEKAEVAQEE